MVVKGTVPHDQFAGSFQSVSDAGRFAFEPPIQVPGMQVLTYNIPGDAVRK